MNTQEINNVSEKYSLSQIESCIRQRIDKGKNADEINAGTDEIITILSLSRAEVVRDLMDHDMKLSDAHRELGRMIRVLYGDEEEPTRHD